jgi:hypothetical protein
MANHASTRDLRPVGEGTDDLRAERFANDSPLEESGFEPLVPLPKSPHLADQRTLEQLSHGDH